MDPNTPELDLRSRAQFSWLSWKQYHFFSEMLPFNEVLRDPPKGSHSGDHGGIGKIFVSQQQGNNKFSTHKDWRLEKEISVMLEDGRMLKYCFYCYLHDNQEISRRLHRMIHISNSRMIVHYLRRGPPDEMETDAPTIDEIFLPAPEINETYELLTAMETEQNENVPQAQSVPAVGQGSQGSAIPEVAQSSQPMDRGKRAMEQPAMDDQPSPRRHRQEGSSEMDQHSIAAAMLVLKEATKAGIEVCSASQQKLTDADNLISETRKAVRDSELKMKDALKEAKAALEYLGLGSE